MSRFFLKRRKFAARLENELELTIGLFLIQTKICCQKGAFKDSIGLCYEYETANDRVFYGSILYNQAVFVILITRIIKCDI